MLYECNIGVTLPPPPKKKHNRNRLFEDEPTFNERRILLQGSAGVLYGLVEPVAAHVAQRPVGVVRRNVGVQGYSLPEEQQLASSIRSTHYRKLNEDLPYR